jgi:cell division septation protein DedD
VPLVIVGLVVIAWLLLAGLPFGRDDDERADAPKVETIAEGTAQPVPQQTGTIVDVSEDAAAPPANTATAAPVTATVPPVVTDDEVTPAPIPVPRPEPARQQPPVRQPAPVPVREQPPVREPAPVPARESVISESEATSVLRGYITSRTYYEGVRTECVQLRATGYQNVGYGFSVWDSCVSGGGSRMLGRWRVDAKTREVFRQREDGRYLRP